MNPETTPIRATPLLLLSEQLVVSHIGAVDDNGSCAGVTDALTVDAVGVVVHLRAEPLILLSRNVN